LAAAKAAQKDFLRQMREENREKYVNDFMDILGMPDSTKQGNRNLDTACANFGTAITFAHTTQLTPQERIKIKGYLDALPLEI
jgi:hypothetical protein